MKRPAYAVMQEEDMKRKDDEMVVWKAAIDKAQRVMKPNEPVLTCVSILKIKLKKR